MNGFAVHGKVGFVKDKRKVGESYVVDFSVADSRKTKDGFATTWWQCSAWGFAADKAEELEKGQEVTAFGARCGGINQYETKAGEQRTELKLDVQSLYPGKKSERTEPSSGGPFPT
jgi:hypothetical protein